MTTKAASACRAASGARRRWRRQRSWSRTVSSLSTMRWWGRRTSRRGLRVRLVGLRCWARRGWCPGRAQAVWRGVWKCCFGHGPSSRVVGTAGRARVDGCADRPLLGTGRGGRARFVGVRGRRWRSLLGGTAAGRAAAPWRLRPVGRCVSRPPTSTIFTAPGVRAAVLHGWLRRLAERCDPALSEGEWSGTTTGYGWPGRPQRKPVGLLIPRTHRSGPAAGSPVRLRHRRCRRCGRPRLT